jgi:hypothetical protein
MTLLTNFTTVYDKEPNFSIIGKYVERYKIAPYAEICNVERMPQIPNTPYLSQSIKEKIEQALNKSLPNKERVCLLKDIAKVAIQYYGVKQNQHVAIQLIDGKIVETAETEWILLNKLHGKIFTSPIFICKS